MTYKSERNWASICHFMSFSGFLFPLFGHILGPLVVWLIKKDESPYVDDQGRESVNFQISMAIYGTIGFLLTFTFSFITFGAFRFLAIPVAAVFGFFQLVAVVIAILRSQEGVYYRYPFAIRFF